MTNTQQAVPLKPCPWCAGTSIEIRPNGIGDYYAICYSDDPGDVTCGARTSDERCESPEHAAERWNRRTTPPQPQPSREEVFEEALREIDRHNDNPGRYSLVIDNIIQRVLKHPAGKEGE